MSYTIPCQWHKISYRKSQSEEHCNTVKTCGIISAESLAMASLWTAVLRAIARNAQIMPTQTEFACKQAFLLYGIII